MERKILFVVLISGLIFSGACARTVIMERTAPLEGADPYYRPQRVYAVDMDRAWELTLKALNQEGIPIEVSDREKGLIRTDYLSMSAWERNKCDLRFSPEPQEKTFIYVRCRYETRKETTEPYRDQTYALLREAMKAEEEIYRRIEPHILPWERTRMAKEDLSARPQAAVSPAEPREKPPAKMEAASPPEGKLQEAAPPIRVREAVPSRPETAPSPTPSAVPDVERAPTTAPLPPKPEDVPSPAPPWAEKPLRTETLTDQPGMNLTAVEKANVRLAPSIKSKVLTLLERGTEVQKVGESGTWTKVKLPNGEIGWVHSDFLQEARGREGIVPAEPTPAKEPSVIPPQPAIKAPPAKAELSPARVAVKPEATKRPSYEAVSKIFLVTKRNVKMRAEPNSTSKVVLVLKSGREVEKIGESGEYTKVRLSWGDTGWVLSRYLERRR